MPARAKPGLGNGRLNEKNGGWKVRFPVDMMIVMIIMILIRATMIE